MTVPWTIAGATGEGGKQTGIGRAACLSTPMTVTLLILNHRMPHTMV